MSDDKTAKTLSTLRVLVTRATHQSGSFTDRLKTLGASVIEMPMLQIAKPESFEPLDTALRQIDTYDWIVFASANAVHTFFNRTQELGHERLPANILLAAIGPGTAKSLQTYGHHPRYQPDQFIAETFISDFPGYPHLDGIRVLWPKGDTGRWLIRDKLTQAGAQVFPVVCYRSTLPEDTAFWSKQLAAVLRENQIDTITLASGQTTKNLVAVCRMALSKEETKRLLLVRIPVVTIGPETSASARELGFRKVEQASQYTTEGMIAVLEVMATTKRLNTGYYRPG